MPAAALADVRATPGVRSAVALTPTTLGPSLGVGDDNIPAQVLSGGHGGGFDVGVTAGSLAALHGDTIALGRRRADGAHAKIGDRVPVMLGDGTRTRATVVAIYTRALGFGDALLAPELAAGHQTAPLLGTILVRPASRRRSRSGCGHGRRAIPGLRVSDRASLASATDADRETNRWLGPLFVAIIFAFTSIAVVNTLAMIALQRGRELALLRLVGGTRGQVRSMARWEAGLIIAIGLGLGLAIAAAALLPLSHALTGSLRPYVPPASSRRSSASPRCWRCWPWRCRRDGHCARGRSRRSGWASRRAIAAVLARSTIGLRSSLRGRIPRRPAAPLGAEPPGENAASAGPAPGRERTLPAHRRRAATGSNSCAGSGAGCHRPSGAAGGGGAGADPRGWARAPVPPPGRAWPRPPEVPARRRSAAGTAARPSGTAICSTAVPPPARAAADAATTATFWPVAARPPRARARRSPPSCAGSRRRATPRTRAARRLRRRPPTAERRRQGRHAGAGVARNSEPRAAREAARRCGRSEARSSPLASPSASADSRPASRSHSAPAWISSRRSENARLPSVRQRFTFVYVQPVISQISRYE